MSITRAKTDILEKEEGKENLERPSFIFRCRQLAKRLIVSGCVEQPDGGGQRKPF